MRLIYESEITVEFHYMKKAIGGVTVDEIKLVKRAIHGNVHAYGELMEEYKELLYRTAFAHVKQEALALDLVSETIVRGYEHVGKLREPQYFKSWLIRILLNVINDYYRRNKRVVSMETTDVELAAETAAWQEGAQQDHGNAVEEKIDLLAAMERLSEKEKSIIVLKYYDDLKISEISAVLEIPGGTVKAYLHKAKGKLRDLLKEDYIYG